MPTRKIKIRKFIESNNISNLSIRINKMEKNLNFGLRKLLTGTLDWNNLRLVIMGYEQRNKLREDVAFSILKRKDFAGKIANDLADDYFADYLGIKEETIGGARCVIWEVE
jgi:hypothetical protein